MLDTTNFPENVILLQNKKNWGMTIFEGQAGMITYQLS
jgi:hypothetical protein